MNNFGTVVGKSRDCLLLSGTVVGENPDHVCWVAVNNFQPMNQTRSMVQTPMMHFVAPLQVQLTNQVRKAPSLTLMLLWDFGH